LINARERARPPAGQQKQPPADRAIEARELKQGVPGFWREPEEELPRDRIGQSGGAAEGVCGRPSKTGRQGSIARAGDFLPDRALRHSGPAGSFGGGALSAPEACCSCAFFICAASAQA